ncbi:glycerophosphodiester phosphodiesterase family protein [Oceanobacillus rekensis]|uniref:glycerophosphodiester phosphodiesterase family protein n=1 Tax=Oceanobacillus rekensis TaxID=937927 RepID=UPI001592F35E|nr:glycerophosphodiester phosphodiesterase family protein [Oceanobacillus rekensis]
MNKKLLEKPFLIASHRGSISGNIIENTIPSMIAAYLSGSDIVEIDVVKSTDGKFYLFHDGNEQRLLRTSKNIIQMKSEEIESFHYYNYIGKKIRYKVEKLEDLLHSLKKDQLINIDRTWNDWETFLPYLDQFGLEKQILLKSPVKEKFLQQLDNHSVKYMYFPIVKSLDDLKVLEAYDQINIVGVELIATNRKSPLFQNELIVQLKEKNLFVFANAIRLDDDTVLFGELDDDNSILKGPEHGWGKAIEKGCNVLQTDWTGLLNDYRNQLI